MSKPLQTMIESTGKLIQWNQRMASGCFFTSTASAGSGFGLDFRIYPHQFRSQLADEPNSSRFVFLDFGKPADIGIVEEIVVHVVVGGRDFANDAFVANR